MAEYSSRPGRYYNRPAPGYPQNHHAQPNNQRDAVFSDIFGAPPPQGRSQTMTGNPMPPDGRAATMTGQGADMMRRAPPMRQPVHEYDRQHTMSNGYAPNRGPPHPDYNGQYSSRQPQPQHLPQPLRPERRPYAMPQRLDGRQGPPPGMIGQKPPPPRFSSNQPGPALASDSYRSQSLASGPRPQMYPPSGAGYNNMAPAQAFRQQPYMNHMAKTTAHGRVVPERPDERTMSMTSYSRDSEYSQTMSGRVIPNRRREPGQDDRTYSNASTVSPVNKARSPSQSSADPNRTMSMASTIAPSIAERTDSITTVTKKPSMASRSNMIPPNSFALAQRRSPLVYPALLAKVAEVFRERISLTEKEKDGLVYSSAFTGSEAVDLISYIIKTTDRNLALLLGRSLDAQKFFHEVAYAHRLRDSSSEIYELKETLMEDPEVNGVFTLLTECYSPTCTRDELCYSIACPRRLEQQARLNMKPQQILKRPSQESLHEELHEEQKLWINTVPKEVSDSVSDREKKRQEVLSEICYTERDFVKDLEYLRDFWLRPLRAASTSPIPEHRREKFVRLVFGNSQEIYGVNSRFAERLTHRQNLDPIVRNVGDVFLEFVYKFEPFVRYGANQLFGKYEFEKEKASNPQFSRFVDEVERMKESRKLELNGYLTKPTTRLARYPLLLENVLKYTADDNPDKKDIPEAIAQIRKVLSRVNIESGKAENHFNLMQLNQQLKFRPNEHVDLKLTEETRRLVFKGHLKKSPTDNQADIQCFLFDHALVLVRQKMVNKREELKVYKKPIPLELLVVPQMEDHLPKMGISKRPSAGLLPGNKNLNVVGQANKAKQEGYPLTFRSLGKGGYEITLYCSSQIQQTKWLEHIESEQRTLRERGNIFTQQILSQGFFTSAIRVNCTVPTDGGRKLVIGTDIGIYVTDRKPRDQTIRPKRVLDCKAVTQIDVLEPFGIVLVLSDKAVYSYPIEALDPDDSQGAVIKRGRKICHANFFKAGVSVGQHLVCCIKTSSLSTTIKIFEPMETVAKNKKKSGIAKILAGGQDVLKPFKEIYGPPDSTSVHFLRTKLCVGCAKGFEIVSLDSLETQSLLDAADTSLDFVARKENVKPIHIERLASEFLLCYSDFSFFVNRNGWRARPDWKIMWEGQPHDFAIFSPYILAFEPSFIEIRHMETGMLVHIVTAKNIRMLHSSTREILYAYEDEAGEDVIASLDFWGPAPANADGDIRASRPTLPQV